MFCNKFHSTYSQNIPVQIGTAVTNIKKYANYFNKSSEMSLFAYLKESRCARFFAAPSSCCSICKVEILVAFPGKSGQHNH